MPVIPLFPFSTSSLKFSTVDKSEGSGPYNPQREASNVDKLFNSPSSEGIVLLNSFSPIANVSSLARVPSVVGNAPIKRLLFNSRVSSDVRTASPLGTDHSNLFWERSRVRITSSPVNCAGIEPVKSFPPSSNDSRL